MGETSLPVSSRGITRTPADDLDNLYASFGEAAVVAPTPQLHRSLEEALFGNIPESESAWAEAWNEGEPGEEVEAKHRNAAAPSLSRTLSDVPPEAHIIHSLTDLVSRTFQDLQGLDLPTPHLPSGGATPAEAVQPVRTSPTALLEPPAPSPKKKRTRPLPSAYSAKSSRRDRDPLPA